MLSLLLGVIFFISCQKDQSSIDEYRYRRHLSLRRPTTSTDSTKADSTNTQPQTPSQGDSTTTTVNPPVIQLVKKISSTTSDVTLDGSASTGAVNYAWSQEVGKAATIVSPSQVKTSVKNLVTGEYRFRLTISNSAGSVSDTVHVSVQIPTSSPGSGNGSSTTTPYQRQNLIFESTFDVSNPFSNFHNPTQTCCSYSITASTEKAYAGSKSMRVELFKTDANVSGSKRAEVVPLATDPINADRWYGASYFFPSSSYGSDSDPESITQWHHSSSTGSPPFALWTWKDQFYVTRVRQVNGGYQNSYYPIGSIPKDQWTSIVIHYNQRADANGKIEVWINGVKKYTEDGVVAFSGVSNYLKIGIYKWPWGSGGSGSQTHRLLYIDEIRYGNEKATYNDVAPQN
jgi:hypothetical protein